MRMKVSHLWVVGLVALMAGCSGSDGKDGANGKDGRDGTDGTNGADGAPGTPGAPGAPGAPGPQGPAGPGGAYSTYFGRGGISGSGGVGLNHGLAAVIAEDEAQGAPANPKYMANIAITSATVSDAGVATVVFTIKKGTTPVSGIAAATNTTNMSGGIFKLAPKETGGRSYNRWVPYIYRTGTGRTVNAGYRESMSKTTPTVVEGPAGTYTFTFATNLKTATFPYEAVAGTLVGYDAALTHRVSVYVGGHAGPTGEADFDFVPAGGAVTQTRNIVQTAACQKCHGAYEFHGHGGDRTTVEGCNACHSPDSKMVNSAANGGTTESIEMAVMIHKIHAGRELASAPGPDGIFYDDPTTTVDESADNGTYTVGSLTATWRSAAFPAGIENCVACHYGTGQNVDNWKSVPSRAACGSCHDTIAAGADSSNWTDASGHPFIHTFANDDMCAGCHGPAGIVAAHDFSKKDIRNVPEFDVSVTTSAPANGKFFVAGEKPVVTVVLKDAATGVAIDHTTVVEDSAAEGCTVGANGQCNEAADGKFRNANMYVTGPRARRVPVLTTSARAKVTSATAGPWNLSAGGASLRVIVDGGNIVVKRDHLTGDLLEDVRVPGDFTVTLPKAGADLNALFANPAAATAAEVVAWLNGPSAVFDYNEREFEFSERAIAYVDGGKVSIRTRAVGSDNPSVQVPDTSKALGLFTDTGIKVVGGAAQLRQRSTASNTDPKLSWTADSLKYELDPVDDLEPGTYMINVEFADRGNATSAVPGSYRTPSIALATFQVKQEAVEKEIAGNCTSCHWSTDAVGQGTGYVLDPIRHNKPFNATAVDQCGGCHDYASGETVNTLTWTPGLGGGKPISKRVHAVHNGVNLQYPVLTVDHEEGTPGRNWKITYPQDIRNCDSCHSLKVANVETMSGTWKTKPGRLACMGCHDTDAATTHMRIQVYDPTPSAPWSGDEAEACAACH